METFLLNHSVASHSPRGGSYRPQELESDFSIGIGERQEGFPEEETSGLGFVD